VLEESVNYINAPHLANKRGVAVSQTNGLPTPNYPNLVSCRVEWNGGERTMAATLFNESEPRLVQMDNYRLDVRPEGGLLVISGQDAPGFIGQVGMFLGEHDVNIGAWRYGRDEPYGTSLSFLRVDSDIPDETLEALRALEPVIWAKKVTL
jgi:D-3-phosphoglycerate dehydrogenase